MKKKGFTLIEMIATIVIISIVSIVIVLGIKAIKEKENEKEWLDTVNRITSAADVYLEKNTSLKNEIYNTGVIKYILLSDIAGTGLLDEKKLVDARDDIAIIDKESEYQEVKVYLNNNDSLEIEYPAIKSSYIVFNSKIIYTIIGTEVDCLNGVSIYDENNEKTNINIIDKIEVKENKYKVINNKVVFEKVGTYELVYTIKNLTFSRIVKVFNIETMVFSTPGTYSVIVPATGNYQITASGAQGVLGGNGGTIIGTIKLTSKEELTVIVGGQSGVYGGGSGYNDKYGGDSSRVLLNGQAVLIGAGGGGGGTIGGGGSGDGGTNNGSGGGTPGKDGSGGGAGYPHNYSCNCSTCGGECNGWKKVECNCKTCGGACNDWKTYSCNCKTCCKGYKRLPCPIGNPKRPNICPSPVCAWWGQCCNTCTGACISKDPTYKCNCQTCNGACNSWKPTYTCNCKTCTKESVGGSGGTSSAVSSVTNVQKINGNQFGTGKVIIEYIAS